MSIDEEKLEELERRAEENDSGMVWFAKETCEFSGEWGVGDYNSPLGFGTFFEGQTEKLCRYIAAVDPTTILRLIDSLKKKDERIAELENKVELQPCPECDGDGG